MTPEIVAAARAPWTSPAIRSWYSAPSLLAQLADGVRQEVAWVGDEEFGAELRGHADSASPMPPLAWANRVLDLPDGGWALCGIRFRQRDNARPFVDVIASTAPPTPDGLATIAAAVAPAYDPWHPLALRANLPDPDAIIAAVRGDSRFVGISVDMYVVAGLVHRLRTRKRDIDDRVRLVPGTPGELAARNAGIYGELYRRDPERARWATPEDADSLADCADEGLLFEVRVHDEPAGVVATMRWDAHGMCGFSVEELALDAEHREKGLGPVVLQRLLRKLPAHDGDALWGTIHRDNIPSLRNALRVGREIVGANMWITPAGWSGMP